MELTGPFRYPPPDREWLQGSNEEPLDPSTPIIDAHHHLWELNAKYLIDEFLEDLSCGHNVVGTVFVQCGYSYDQNAPIHLQPVGETKKVVELANEGSKRTDVRLCAGIVGFADLALGGRVEQVLDAHLQAGEGRFRGIRHSGARDKNYPDGIVFRPPKEGLLADFRFREGVRRLAARDLTYDAFVYHPQLSEVADLGRALPQARIVLDHCGTFLGIPPYDSRPDEVFASWRQGICELGQIPNIILKFGGLGMFLTGFKFHQCPKPPSSRQLAEAWRPYFDICIEAFGAERVIFESNFPVDKAMMSYSVLWNAFKRLSSGASDSERAALFHDNAARTYRLVL